MAKPIELLQALGLNHLEAEVYVLLLAQEEPITAYRVGKSLGKPTANVYKAIEALTRKGAVIIDEGEPRRCRPVPVEEFLGQLEQTFLGMSKQAARRLADLESPPPDERIYHLGSVPAVLERCRAMLGRVQRIAVLDVFPAVFEAVRTSIDEAVGRGAEVYVQVYEATELDGAHVVRALQSDRILRHWKSQQLNCVIDGRETLLALLHSDLAEVHEAIWTSSLFLSCVMHAGLLREHVFHEVAALQDQEDFPPSLRTLLKEHPSFHSVAVPGQKLLFSRLGVEGE